MGYQKGDSASKVREVDWTELVIHEHHELLAQSSEIFESSATFTLAHSFKIDSPWEKKLDIRGQDVYKYYENLEHRDIIQGHYVIDTLTKGSKVTFIALQGNTGAKLRLPNDSVWYDALEISYADHGVTTVPLEIKWDVKGANELTLFPLRQDEKDLYSGGNLGIIRMCILNDKFNFTQFIKKIVIDQQSIKSSLSFMPIPSLTDNDGDEPKLNIQDDMVKVSKPYNSITLQEISYETKLDVLVVDEGGKVEILQTGVWLLPNKKTRIPLPDKLLEQIQNDLKRHFVMLLNNRGEELLTDMKAFADEETQFPTSFSLIIELYKLTVPGSARSTGDG
ncbi:hypothetical protein QJ48_28940 [Paenibacillus sp. A3]|uniref:hypothetical protein n=1 Tax=Paenibacillus sp. A3 TaxID=1337054 RepID=UPI0006D52DD9|nr:hypothetical protein [Paenibacillus sp. A3]KPV56191.1 hypothetical protein QJ48_28940 [Paenibacillus sp. A3]